MKLRATLVVTVVVLSLLASATAAMADGTETLGAPSIPIAPGTGLVAAGVGTRTQPAVMQVTVPADAAVRQVLLYWEGQAKTEQVAGDDTITVNGVDVAGTKIGGETPFFVGRGGGPDMVHSSAYRADITADMLVADGGSSPTTSTITVAGMDFSYENNGAGVVVVYDDGSAPRDIQLRDGIDLAYAGFKHERQTTVPQTYSFEAAPVERTATLSLFATSVAPERPNAVDIQIDVADTTTVANPFNSADGPDWDTTEIPVTIPAGAGSVTVQAVSRDDGSGRQPASLAWVGSFLSVPTYVEEPPPAPTPKWCPKPLEWWKQQLWMKLAGKLTKFEGSGYSYHDVANASSKDPYFNLASEYVALELNRLWKADTSAVAEQRAEAKQLLGEYLKKRHKVTGDVAEQFGELAEQLEEFNSGALTPGCDVWEDDDHDGGGHGGKDHDGKGKDKDKHKDKHKGGKGWGGWGRR